MSTVKRKLLARMVALTALVLSVILIGVHNAGAGGADVYGLGAGSINLGGGQKAIKFAFSAHSGPDGDFGSFHFTINSSVALCPAVTARP